MSQLNGNHVFICGNHDKNNGTNSPIRFCVIESYGKKMLLTHRPEDAEMIMAGGGIDLALVGHVHEKWTFRENMVNVGVDQWDYYPIDARQILKAYNRFKQQ
jgi:calcineurin-like phosphoesterase family protein